MLRHTLGLIDAYPYPSLATKGHPAFLEDLYSRI